MRRLAILVLALVLVAGGVVALAPVLVPTELIRERMIEQVSQWLGRPVTALGEPVISLYPRPTVRIEGVTIGNADGSGQPFMTVAEATGTVGLLPLLFGRVEIREFELVRPTIALTVDENGKSNWAITEGTLGARVAEAQRGPDEPVAETAATDVTLGRFIITDGTITYQSATDLIPVAITEVSLDISWPSTGDSASARGSFVWRGERVDITASLAAPLELIAARPSAGRFRINAAPVIIAFEGMVGRDGLDFRFEGESSVRANSLRRLLAWAGAEIVDGPTLRAASIAGNAAWAWPILSFSAAAMSLDGNQADGAFTVDFGNSRPFIRGTIAADDLDLSAYALAFQTDVQADGAWTGAAIDLPVLALIDSDIRLSAARVLIGTAEIDGVAASAVVSDGHIDIGIGDAELYGGRLQASITGEIQPPLLSILADISVVNMAALPAFTYLLGVTSVTGTARGSMHIAGSGTNWGELVENLSGTLSTSIVNGSMAGVDIPAVLAMPEPTVDQILAAAEATHFDRFEASFRFDGGRLLTESMTVHDPAFELAFAGEASLRRPTIEGHGVVLLKGPAGNREMPFVLGGTWFAPTLEDDPDPMPSPFVVLPIPPSVPPRP